MKFLGPLALASMALATPRVWNTRKASSPLDLRIEMDGNSKVRAVLTNRGDHDLRLLKTGTFLDEAPVEKAKIYTSCKSSEPHPSPTITQGYTRDAHRVLLPR